MVISAAKFKAKCLKLMNQVNEFHEEIIITKYGKPVAKLVPYSQIPAKSVFGFMNNSIVINSDIITSIDEDWESDLKG